MIAGGPRDATPWLSGDALDPKWLGDPNQREEGEPFSTFAGLYTFDGANYESVLVGLHILQTIHMIHVTQNSSICSCL